MQIYIDRLEELMWELTHNEFFTKRFLEEADTLPKTEGKLIVSGFDETLFSREEMRESEELLKNNPEDAINRLVKFQLGVPYIMAKYFEWKDSPKDISDLMTPNNSVIITTGFEDIQQAKLQALGLSHIPNLVLKEKQEKIIALLQYILYTLKYIPSEIVIYEDQPQDFVQYRELIEWILACKLTIMQVEMDANISYKKIENI